MVDPVLRKLLGRFYGAIDLKTAGQSFHREVTAELIRALSSTARGGSAARHAGILAGVMLRSVVPSPLTGLLRAGSRFWPT